MLNTLFKDDHKPDRELAGLERLGDWMFPPKGDNQQIEGEIFKNVGAVVMGRRMFDLGEEPWGDNPSYHMPVFVLTHRPKSKLIKEGGTTFTFITGVVFLAGFFGIAAGSGNPWSILGFWIAVVLAWIWISTTSARFMKDQIS
jgi:hypothetical protein